MYVSSILRVAGYTDSGNGAAADVLFYRRDAQIYLYYPFLSTYKTVGVMQKVIYNIHKPILVTKT